MKICRLCLNTTSNKYEELKFIDKQHLELVLPEIDFNVIRSPVFCLSCIELLSTSYSFKKICLKTDGLIKDYLEKFNRNEIELSEILNKGVLEDKCELKNELKSELRNELGAKVELKCENESYDDNDGGFNDDYNSFELNYLINSKVNKNELNDDGKNDFNVDFNEEFSDDLSEDEDKSLINKSVDEIKCEICFKTFTEKISLTNHTKSHFYRLKCLGCSNKSFCTVQSFRKHILASHKLIFKKKFQDIEDLLKIIYNKSEKDNFPVNCFPCGEKISDCKCSNNISCINCNNKPILKDNYFKHKLVHLIKNNNFLCECCQKNFMRKSALTRHIEEVHLGIKKQYKPRSIYTCDMCGLTTHRKSRLTQHIRTHTGEKPYKCDDCGKAFVQSSQLGVHKRTKHSEVFRFTCEYCSKRLKSKYSLDMHILIMHKPEELERKFECHVCSKKFRFPGELTNHLTWHSEERKFSCEICGKRFVNQPSVKKHMVIHSGEKKHKCEICGKGFHHKSYIKVHMKVHKRIM